jgi:hypothetical protein
MNNLIGITEGADPTVNFKWKEWVNDGKPAILITKMPRLFNEHLNGTENVIIHCTITGLGGSNIEPNIDNTDVSIKYYRELCDKFGADRVVLRVDPIMPELQMINLTDVPYLVNIRSIIKKSRGRTRISFLDLYSHVRGNLLSHGYKLKQTFHYELQSRFDLWHSFGEPEICGEPDMPSTPCVSAMDCEILGVEPILRDKGQRLYCHCLANKMEICRPPPKCTYGCLYCYWR